MALQVKFITLWRSEAQNQPGTLADTLEPLAGAGVDIQLLMGYRDPTVPGRAVLELYPVSGKKAEAAAERAGLSKSSIPTLLVSGDNKAGLGEAIARVIGEARINMAFLMAQVIGKRFSAVIGFQTEGDARTAASLIRKVKVSRR